jgi:cysteine desulfurase
MPFIYLDYNATTPLDPKVLEAIMPYLTTSYANAASTHQFGLHMRQAVEQARQQVADLIGSSASEIIFTSGATESINLALKGIAQSHKGHHIITLTTEHKAVLDTCQYLESIGYEIDYLPVQTDGILDLHILKSHLRQDTVLVAVMLANNETGVIQPIEQIAEITHQAGAYFFTDATQAFGKLPINVEKSQIDMLAFSGHKIYGPKGIGGLYVKKGLSITAILHGGGHEQNLRSGTLNVPGIIGLGKAAQLANQYRQSDTLRVTHLRNTLETELLQIQGTSLNGNPEERLYNTSNISFEGIHADVFIQALANICVSSGSACTAAIPEPSYVLQAMGLTSEQAFGSLRFSLGRFTTTDEIKIAIQTLKNLVTVLRRPTYQNA